jgi:hypothetical protein
MAAYIRPHHWLHSTNSIHNTPPQQTPFSFLSLLQKIKILTVFRNHQEQWRTFPNPRISRNQNQTKLSWILHDSQRFKLESSSSNRNHCNSSTNSSPKRRIRTITVERVRRGKIEANFWTSEEEKEELPIYFRFKPLPEESEDFLRIF